MSSLELTLEQAVALTANDDARADVRTLGALAVAAIMVNNHRDDFDADMIVAIDNLVTSICKALEP